MPLKTSYIFIASMDVDPDKEALFHEVYDTEHVPFLSSVPGVHGVSRTERQPLTLSLGGELKEMVFDDELKEQIAALRAIGMDDKQILGHLKDTGGARAPMTQKFAMRVLLNQWEPLNFEIK